MRRAVWVPTLIIAAVAFGVGLLVSRGEEVPLRRCDTFPVSVPVYVDGDGDQIVALPDFSPLPAEARRGFYVACPGS